MLGTPWYMLIRNNTTGYVTVWHVQSVCYRHQLRNYPGAPRGRSVLLLRKGLQCQMWGQQHFEKNFAGLCCYLKLSPTKWKRQRRVRCGASGSGGQGPTGVGAAVRIRAQDYRITRWPTWTGGRRERGGECRHWRPRVLKTEREREREKERELFFTKWLIEKI